MFNILVPVKLSPPTEPVQIIWPKGMRPHHRTQDLELVGNPKKLLGSLKGFKEAEIVALDWETQGTFVPCRHPNQDRHCIPVGLALSWYDSSILRSVYFVLNGRSSAQVSLLKHIFNSTEARFASHNLMFDGSIVLRELGYWPEQLNICTFAMCKHLAGEGFEGQKWGLKWLQTNLLGWPETNESEIDGWLIRNGHWSSSSAEDAYSWGYTQTGGQRKVKPIKSKMYLCPPWVLGRYAGLDTASTLQLYTHVLKPAIEKHGGPADIVGSYDWFWSHFITTIKECAQSYLAGLPIDIEKLSHYYCDIQQEIYNIETKFRNDPAVQALTQKMIEEAKEEYKTKEPSRTVKSGLPSKAWENWWQSYIKLDDAKPFNLNSRHHLSRLFYEELKYPVAKRTEKGDPSVDSAALATFGELGKLRLEYGALNKKLTAFLTPYINTHLYQGRIHPSFSVPEAVTGRLSSKEPNIQQLSKDKRLLEVFIPNADHILVDADFAAIENIVLAELSQDPSMLLLYGGDSVNDPHLYTAAGIAAFRDKILAAGYDPKNPTEEGIANAKKVCKKERAAAKKVNYSIIYGIGANKLSMDLSLEGIPTSYDEAKEMIEGWWQTYEGVRDFKQRLEHEYNKRGGWIRNGIGRPIAVDKDKTKDLISRVVQSTAHDLLTLYIHLLVQYRDKECEFPFRLYIPDWHDQTMCEVKPEYAQQLKHIMETVVPARLNEILNPSIPIKMEATICKSIADSKF